MPSRFPGVSLFPIMLLACSSATADSISISGTSSQMLSPSADTLTLTANSQSVSDGQTFTLQSGIFGVGNSGNLMGDYPVNVLESVSLNGATSPIAFAGVISVTNPTSLNQDQLTLTALPVFFPSLGASLTPTVTTSQAGGVGASIPISIQANLTLPPVTPADKKISAYTAFALSGLTIAFGICVVAEPCGAIVTSAGATAADVAAVSGGTMLVSGGYGLLAADPPDYNYTVVALPEPPIIPSLSASAPSSFINIVTAEADADSLMTAMITAYNRAQGATLSNAPAYAQIQLNAYDTYESQLNQDFVIIGTEFDQVQRLIGSQYPNLIGTYADDLISSVNTTTTPEPSAFFLGGIGIALLLAKSKIFS